MSKVYCCEQVALANKRECLILYFSSTIQERLEQSTYKPQDYQWNKHLLSTSCVLILDLGTRSLLWFEYWCPLLSSTWSIISKAVALRCVFWICSSHEGSVLMNGLLSCKRAIREQPQPLYLFFADTRGRHSLGHYLECRDQTLNRHQTCWCFNLGRCRLQGCEEIHFYSF